MTATDTAPRSGAAGFRRAAPFVLLALAVVAIGLLNRSRQNDGRPLDPTSTGPLGARALVLLLEQVGAEVAVTSEVPEPTTGTVVLLQDRLSSQQGDRLERWVESGGTLVVADPLSDFAPALSAGEGALFDEEDPGEVLRPRCGLPALSRVGRIEVPGAAPLRARGDAVGCFPVSDGFFVVVRPSGAGVIAAVGGGGGFINRQVDEADNSVLAVSLMAPRPGTVVTILGPAAVGGGDRTLLQLVSRRVKDGLWQLLVAFGLFALWRSRRLGRPIVEVQPVQIAGSELVVATGNLLRQARRRDAAAGMLRAQVRRTMSERLGVPWSAPAEVFAQAAAARSGADADKVMRLLDGPPPVDDDALVTVAQAVEELRNEVSHAR